MHLGAFISEVPFNTCTHTHAHGLYMYVHVGSGADTPGCAGGLLVRRQVQEAHHDDPQAVGR